MRNDTVAKQNLDLYSTFSVYGLNQDRLIKNLQKKGVELRNVKKISNKHLKISIFKAEEKKFFAITKNMCYNIKREKFGGKFFPLYYLFKNIGLIIGAIILIAVSVFLNDFIFDFDFVGDGKTERAQIQRILEDNGVKKYSRFSKINLKSLANKILISSNNLSFASCEKVGNTLKINVALFNQVQKQGLGQCSNIVAECEGVIEEIKVYRGTAVKSVGESVLKGETIVSGFTVVKDQTVEVNPIAYVSIISKKLEKYVSKNDGEEEFAKMLIENLYIDKDIVEITVEKQKQNDNYIYNVCLYVRVITFK